MTKIPFLNFDPIHIPLKKEIMEDFETYYDSGWFVLGN